MTKLPPRPDFEAESDAYFAATYLRAVEEQNPIVCMSNWKMANQKNPANELLEAWQERGFGRIHHLDDGLTKHVNFSISDSGVAYGKKLLARQERRKFAARFKRNALPISNLAVTILATAAAIAAAYFSYLGLHDK